MSSHTSPPEVVNPKASYLFYLHGKIIEDQGIEATSTRYGPYQYRKIIRTLEERGFVVISEARPKSTDPWEYARKIVGEIENLKSKGLPSRNITVVGASKGALITIFVSHLSEDDDINYVLLATCSRETVDYCKRRHICVRGKVLSIYDAEDTLAGSCGDLYKGCEDSGLKRHKEIELDVGTGHGIVYRPLDEWIQPVLDWAK